MLFKRSRKRFGSEFHVDGPATANARPPYVTRRSGGPELSVDGWQPNEDAVVTQSQSVGGAELGHRVSGSTNWITWVMSDL